MRSSFRVFVLVPAALTIAASMPDPAAAESCPSVLGRVPYGPAQEVAVESNHVYYSSGAMLMIADATTPDAPVIVGELQLPGLIFDIKVADGFEFGDAGSWAAAVDRP